MTVLLSKSSLDTRPGLFLDLGPRHKHNCPEGAMGIYFCAKRSIRIIFTIFLRPPLPAAVSAKFRIGGIKSVVNGLLCLEVEYAHVITLHEYKCI